MASNFDSNPFAKSGIEETNSRRAPIIINGVGPQILPNASCQLIETTKDMDTFSFGPSFYNTLDDSDCLSGSHHSPEQTYHNSQDKGSQRDHGLKSPDDLSQEVTPNSAVDNERRWCKLKGCCNENREEMFSTL